jgi:hypothetical protein
VDLDVTHSSRASICSDPDLGAPAASAPMGDDPRNDSRSQRLCPVCEQRFHPVGRGRFCSPSCRQRAFRLRHCQPNRVTLTQLTARLRRARRLLAQTVYECPSCQERSLGERRCPDCNLMCRKLGLGGECHGCADILTIGELLDLDLDAGDSIG